MSLNIAGGDHSAMSAPSIGSLATPRPTSAGSWIRNLPQRIVRFIAGVLVSLPPSTWLLVDIFAISAGVYVAFQIYPPPGGLETPHVALWQAVAIYSFAVMLASLVFGLYERDTVRTRLRIFTRLLLTAATSTIVAYAVIYILMYATVGRRISGVAMTVFLLCGTSVRWCAWWAIHKKQRGLLVVGSRSLLESFEEAQSGGLLREYNLEGYVTVDERESEFDGDPCYCGSIAKQIPLFRERRITDIVVSSEAAIDRRVMDWMVPCLQEGCRVTSEAIFYEKATGQILVDEITPAWFLFADLKGHCEQHATLKRVVDMFLALVGLVLIALLTPLIALAIKLDDGGRVFYGQQRVGQNGRLFRLRKFRTMRADAEKGKSVWAAPGDPRVTRVGRFLRRTRLDELPQFYNVLLGEMSLVGPRPERPDIVEALQKEIPFYAERHLVKPGITGWAQISYRYGSSVADAKRKLQFDLYYLKEMTFELDVIILFRTLGTFLRGAC